MLETVTTGLRFPEGPISMNDGSVLLVEVERGTLTRVGPDGCCDVVAEVGGGPNGAAIGPDGMAYICNNGGNSWADVHGMRMPHGPSTDYLRGSIQRVDLKTGRFETLYEACDGDPLRGPNDIIFDAAGGFWFSDFGKDMPGMRYMGAIYYALADGSRITRVAGGMLTPNGIGLSPDERRLHVADTYSGRVLALDVTSPGEATPTSHPLFPGLLTHTPAGLQMLDSLAVEEDGTVAVATIGAGGITRCFPDGGMDFVAVPDPFPTNICFGGPDMNRAWITGSGTGTLFTTQWPQPGLRLLHQRHGTCI